MEEDKLSFATLIKECRFCFGSDTTLSPLIAPCNCKGTQEYIHSECLSKWQRIQVNNRPWSSKFCSVCRHPYTIRENRNLVYTFSNIAKHQNIQILTMILKFISIFFLIIYTKILCSFILSLGGPVALILLLLIIASFIIILIFEHVSNANIANSELRRDI
ncbi:hypothetical protein FG386_002438 [Cryptosporidium ryanae]|uniref:uncharacterized protein n=1 Tax=Cryptosporidium ryanae TaxID=515981 RepID=UPI00351A41C6|nr:hypothetical protein FG386_002438 [Cryptosporidium ryanae]